MLETLVVKIITKQSASINNYFLLYFNLIDFEQAFDYCRLVRHSFFEVFSELSWDEFSKNREASFYSMKNIFIHTLDVEDRLFNYIIPRNPNPYSRTDFDDYPDMASLKLKMDTIESKTIKFFQQLSLDQLDNVVTFPRKNLPDLEMSVKDVLMQALTEELQHRGEFLTLLWQIGIDPPSMTWLWYLDVK